MIFAAKPLTRTLVELALAGQLEGWANAPNGARTEAGRLPQNNASQASDRNGSEALFTMKPTVSKG